MTTTAQPVAARPSAPAERPGTRSRWVVRASRAAVGAIAVLLVAYQTRIDSSFAAGRIARVLVERGYSVLLFDLRGHGESEG